MSLSWNKNLETGIIIMDRQHKELIENLNRFFDINKIDKQLSGIK